MGGVVYHTELHAPHLGSPLPGPDLATAPIGFGATPPQGGQTRQWLGGQPAGCTRWPPMAHSRHASIADPLDPLADGRLAAPQGFGDLALRPALRLEAPGLEPSGLLPVVGCRVQAWQESTASCLG
jgi:hypothetical protein